MTLRESAFEWTEMLLLPGIMARGVSNQLAFVWLTGGEDPPTKPPRELTTELPLELGDDVSRGARRRLRLTSTFAALFWAAFLLTLSGDALMNTLNGCPPVTGPTRYGAVCKRLVWPESIAVQFCMGYLVLQWLFFACWDPLVMLVRSGTGQTEVAA